MKNRRAISQLVVLGILGLSCSAPEDAPELGRSIRAGYNQQGYNQQGYNQQGYNQQGSAPSGSAIVSFRLDSLLDLLPPGAPPRTAVDRSELVQGHLEVLRSRISGVTGSFADCAPGTPAIGTSRGCGWRSAGLGKCVPGAPVFLGEAPGGACSAECTGDPMLRVCAGTAPCEAGIAASDDCGGTCPGVSFACPSSGNFNVMIAPHTPGLEARVTLRASGALYPFYDWSAGTSLADCPETVLGGARSCGYQSLGYGTCAPGSLVDLSSGAASCDGRYLLRVCDGTAACTQGSARELGSSAAATEHDCPQIKFFCGASGHYRVLAGGYSSAVTTLAMSTGGGPRVPFLPTASAGTFPFTAPSLAARYGEQPLLARAIEARQEGGTRVKAFIGAVRAELPAYRCYDPASCDAARYAGATLRYEIWTPVLDPALCDAADYPPPASAVQPCHTFLDSTTGAPVQLTPLCGPDEDGERVAIPVRGVWDRLGAASDEDADQITFSCRLGVIGKCYRWGYRAWDAESRPLRDQLRDAHEMCTRMARADYCGDGHAWTVQDTTIDAWDQGPTRGRTPPEPTWLSAQSCTATWPHCRQAPASGAPPAGAGDESEYSFEAGWDTRGAVCLSHQRWENINKVSNRTNPDHPAAQFPFIDCPRRLYNPSYLEATEARVTASSTCTATIGDPLANIVIPVRGFTWPPGSTTCVTPSVCDTAEGECDCGNGAFVPLSPADCFAAKCSYTPGGLDFGPDARLFDRSRNLDAELCAGDHPEDPTCASVLLSE